MIIKLDSMVLCDGATRAQDKSAGPIDLRTGGKPLTAVVPLLRAVKPSTFDRGNRSCDVRFGIARLCATVAAADSWKLLHMAAIAARGQLYLELDTGAKVRLEDALLDDVQASSVGCTVFVDYKFTGGRLVTA